MSRDKVLAAVRKLLRWGSGMSCIQIRRNGHHGSNLQDDLAHVLELRGQADEWLSWKDAAAQARGAACAAQATRILTERHRTHPRQVEAFIGRNGLPAEWLSGKPHQTSSPSR